MRCWVACLFAAQGWAVKEWPITQGRSHSLRGPGSFQKTIVELPPPTDLNSREDYQTLPLISPLPLWPIRYRYLDK
jgi:hypothetical protein